MSYARANGLPTWDGKCVYKLAGGVDWQRYLRVNVPPSGG